MNWNIAGATLNDGDNHVSDRITEVLERRPDIVTLNEVCRSQFDYLTKRLAGVGWQMRGHFVIGEAFNITCYNDGGSGGDPGVMQVCKTHLDTEEPNRDTQVRELARVFGPEARQMPFILAGDTNIPTPPENAAMGALYGAPLGTGDSWERACVTIVPVASPRAARTRTCTAQARSTTSLPAGGTCRPVRAPAVRRGPGRFQP